MIEVPAAALALPMFMRRLDFLSIGTNDLIQYTLAIDRTDDAVAHLYDPLHPAVLHLIAHTIQTATRGGMPVAVCGEMAGDLQLTRLLLGFGLRNFSMHPRSCSRSRSACCAPTSPRCSRSRSACCAQSDPGEDARAARQTEFIGGFMKRFCIFLCRAFLCQRACADLSRPSR